MNPGKEDKQKKFKVNINYENEPAPAVKKVGGGIKKVCKAIFKMFFTLLLICVITGSIVATILSVYIMKNVDTAANVDLSNIDLNYTTIIYGTNNNGETVEVKRLYRNGNNRIPVDLEQVPKYTRLAFVCTEDKRFYEHNGVDFKRTVSAFANLFLNLYKTKQGGSTITQQLIKNITGEDDFSIERKVQEIFHAINLEKEYSKDDILEAYMNTAYFANGCNGIQAAANLYFGKDVSRLTLAESASIIAITNYPSYYDPFVNPENNNERKEYILKNMLDLGAITQEEYDQAMAQKLVYKKTEFSSNIASIQNYYVDAVIDDVIKGLQQDKGYSYETATNKVYAGGYRIYTSLNVDVQNALESVYTNPANFPKRAGEEQPQSSVVTMDLHGNVVGLVGGVGEKSANRILNRATQTRRSIGSTMKPIGAYGPAIEYDLINFSTILEDSPYHEIQKDWPVNYYHKYYGNMTVTRALQLSTNTVATKVCGMVTPEKSFDFLTTRLGLPLVNYRKTDTGVVSDKSIAPLSLGSLTDGFTAVELAAAYEPFGNGGTYYSPRIYNKVIDTEGTTVIEKKSTEIQAFTPESATVMNKLLQNVVIGPEGTGRSTKFGNWEIAAKTGTTSDNKDFWYVGLTPHYVTAVWYGYDIPKEAGSTSSITLQLWKKCMTKIHEGLPDKKFPYAEDVQEHRYCNKSGKLATANCASTAIGWYKPSNVPGYCNTCG